jgi:gas vesicle protein
MRDDGERYIVIDRDHGGGVGSFILGALVGAGVALLLAPKTGEEAQAELRERARKLRETAEERVREAQASLEDRISAAREDLHGRVDKVKDAVDAGRDAAREYRTELEDKLERSKAAYRSGVAAAREEYGAIEGETTEAEAED